MKASILFFTALLWFSHLKAQDAPLDSAVSELMMEGIAFHDEGKYVEAIEKYKSARLLDEDNGFINYELALSYYYLQRFKESISYAKVASKEASENGLQAIILLGSIYDELGKYKKSIKCFEKGIESFGDYYLIWYNLGVTALGNDDPVRAEEAFMKAISNKLDHANSHFALGRTLLSQGRRAEAMFPLLFHNMLQPRDERAEVVYRSVEDMLAPAEKVDGTLEIVVDDNKTLTTEQRSAELMLAMLSASQSLEKYDTLSAEEVEVELLRSHFKFMEEMEWGKREDLFTNYYFPFFNGIGQSDHLTTMYHYVRLSNYDSSAHWCDVNDEALSAMFDAMDELGISPK